jgi:pimeloyl-ACP methyl ester carboxylesterase
MRGVLFIPGFNGTFLVDRSYPNRNIGYKTTMRNASTYIDFDLFMGLTEKEWTNRMKMEWNEKEKRLIGNSDIVTLSEYDENIDPIHAVSNLSQELFFGDETINSFSMNNIWCLNKKTGYKYFHTMAQSFDSLGYEIKALPYDFRRIGDPEYMENLYERMKSEIYSFNKNSYPITIIGHSMGGLISRDFIVRQTEKEWCRKYIHCGISIGTPYMGIPSIYNQILPLNEKYSSWQDKTYANVAMTLGGIGLCLSGKILEYKSENQFQFDIVNDDDFDMKLGFPLMKMRKLLFKEMINGLYISTPIPFHRIIGKNIKTQTMSIMKNNCIDNSIFLYGDGDGLVPIESALAGNAWEDGNVFMINNAKHALMIQDEDVIQLVISLCERVSE